MGCPEPLRHQAAQVDVGRGLAVVDLRIDDNGGGWSKVGFHVKDDGLHVVGSLLQFPEPLIGTCLILQSKDDEQPVDGFAAMRPIFQQFLRFLQADESLLEFVVAEMIDSHLVEFSDFENEMIYIITDITCVHHDLR